MSATLVWFRHDLRLQDNPALAAAVKRGGPVVPVFIGDAAAEGDWPEGPASRWWRHQSLAALDQSLAACGSRLILARGETGAELRRLARQAGATAVYWNTRYEPGRAEQEAGLVAELAAAGIEGRSFSSALLFDPAAVRTKAGGPFQVFTPFWRHCLTLPVAVPVSIGRRPWMAPARWPGTLKLAELDLLTGEERAEGWARTWTPGEAGAAARLRRFVGAEMAHYAEQRDRPAVAGTSALSPHLHFGEVSPRQVWAAVEATGRGSGVFPPSRGAQVFLKELGWREFAAHLLVHFPHTPERPLRPEFEAFPWRADARDLRAWQQGRTGYPIVDAGMRQLGTTGWMHNRVRMIVASFLVKDLRISWRRGAEWFWETLVDADLASNTLGWQWTSGCGADAAPFFRIFNPVLQARKFDPDGDYVRRWVPELAQMPTAHLHQPWSAPDPVLAEAGVLLGKTYPRPIVDHGEARIAALAALRTIRKNTVPRQL